MDLLFLLALLHVFCLTEAQDKTYLITAPKKLRLDASESILVQLFGYEQETTVDIYLKDSKHNEAKIYSSQSLKLNAHNNYQAMATLRIFQTSEVDSHVYLEAKSISFTVSEEIPVIRNNGFLFIQTDKPLYTPEQKVEVRVYSLNQELRRSNRPVSLTFRDPDGTRVEIVELSDINGVKPLLPPFKIPLKPKFGVWKIEAAYTNNINTTAMAEFEVKEYVLPSISVHIQPDTNYITTANFEAFRLKIFARYVHGDAVDSAEVFIRFGYVQGDDVVMIPSTLRHYKMNDGELEVVLNIKKALSRMASGPQDLSEMENNFLRVVVLLQESTGGISQGAILSNIKFVHAPFTLSLIATPPFIKPSLPYNIRVLVSDPLGEPVRGVAVKARATFTDNLQESQPLKFLGHLDEITLTSQGDGVAYFICNIPSNAERVEFDFETADQKYPLNSQAQLKLRAEAYKSINHRYLYIDLPSDYSTFEVDSYATINIHFYYREYLPLQAFSYQIISKGKVVKFATEKRVNEKIQSINFKVTADMVPSARLVVYYILSGEQRAELVADSVWLDIKAKCVNGLNVQLVSPGKEYKPKDRIQLSVKTKGTSETSLVALSAVDMALYNIRVNDKDPLNKVLRHFESSDLGCGGGGGQNNVDVFGRAGLTLISNANVKTSIADETCTASVRPKRSTPSLAKSYMEYKSCCMSGTESIPTLETCLERTKSLSVTDRKCRGAFFQCCVFAEQRRAQTKYKIILSRLEVPANVGITSIRSKRSTSNLKERFGEVVPDSAGIPAMRQKCSLNDEFENKAKKYMEYKSCCMSGTNSSPTLETCLDRTKRLSVRDQKCKVAFNQCCMYAEDLRAKCNDKIILNRLVPDSPSAPAMRKKRSTLNLNDEFENKAKSYMEYKSCCMSGTESIPTLETCLERTKRLSVTDRKCRGAFFQCCVFAEQRRAQTKDKIILSRSEMDFLQDVKTVQVRSYFPESWLWEEHEIDKSGLLSISKSLPDSLTTWEMKAVGVFNNGMCVADPLHIPVSQAVSVDVPLPYSLVRGEQIELKGSVYNKNEADTKFSVTLSASDGVCVFRGTLSSEDGEPHENKGALSGRSVALVQFYIMALEVGNHKLSFTLQTKWGRETVIKTLRVVPEGIRREQKIGGRLDPQAVYGQSITRIELRNTLPPNLVPKSTVERLITVNGEVLGEMLSIINDPKGLMQLTNLPRGSAEVELVALLPIFYVYDYIEQTEQWSHIEESASSSVLKRKMKEGINSIMSFKLEREHSFSLWKNKEASTWLTALVVKTLALVDKYVEVDQDILSKTIRWLGKTCQNQDGSFTEKSKYKPIKLMGAGGDVTEQSVYLTSFVIIGIKNALEIPKSNLQTYQDSLDRAAQYLSTQVLKVKNLYVRAIAAYALTLVDPNSFHAVTVYEKLKKEAQTKENPVVYRFWGESNANQDPLTPNRASATTVETTTYILLTTLLRGDTTYAKPVLNWLTQDQRYGGGFLSTQDAILTLEALTKYKILLQKAFLQMSVDISYRRRGNIGRVTLTQRNPVGKPIEVTHAEDIILKTGYSSGVVFANLRTVYYETAQSNDNCHFDLSIDVYPRDPSSGDPMQLSPRIVACAKYKPRQNEVITEAAHTVMEIKLPTGVSPVLQDLTRFRDGLESRVSDFEILGDQLILQMDSIPSDEFYCVGFRIQEVFQTGMNSASMFKVYEYHAPESQCTKLYYSQSRRLLQLCDDDQCQCMAAECCVFKTSIDPTITVEQRRQDLCKNNMKYVLRITVTSTKAEGDFLTYNANVEQILEKGLENIVIGSEIGLLKKATCSSTSLEIGKQYLFMGVEMMKTRADRSFRYKFPLDSKATVEWWPSDYDCPSSACKDHADVLNDFELDYTLNGCSG